MKWLRPGPAGRLATLAALFWVAPIPPVAAAEGALSTIEGDVTAIAERLGEGELTLVAIALRREEDAEPIEILLAPRGALEEIGFTVEVGDHLKVRVFADADAPAHAQRVLNVTRGSMVRLRTLDRTPLWSGTGTWQGGSVRGRPGLGPGAHPGNGPGGPSGSPGGGPGR